MKPRTGKPAKAKGELARSRPALVRPAQAGILVLGMHRSGTSAITRVLGLLGAQLGDRLMPAQTGVNDKGFWEHVDAVALHERLLNWHDSNWTDIGRLPRMDLDEGVGRQAVDDAREIIRRDFGQSRLWALKDPRMSLFAPVWLQAMAEEAVAPAIIIAVRHPGEVAASLAKRDGLTRGHAYLLWGRHVVEALRASEGLPRAVSDYAGLLGNWRRQLTEVGRRLSIQWPIPFDDADASVRDFLSEGDRHHRQEGLGPGSDDPVERCVFQLYDLLSQIAAGSGDWGALGLAAAEFDRLSDALAPHLSSLLRHVWIHAERANRAEKLASLSADADETDRIRKELASLREHAQALLHERDAAVLRAEAHNQLLAEREQRLADLHVQLGQQVGYLAELRQHADGLEELRRELEGQLQETRAQSELQLAETRARDGRVDALERVLAEKEQRLVALAADLEGSRSHLAELRQHATALEGVRRDLEHQAQGEANAAELLRSELRAREAQLAALSDQLGQQSSHLSELGHHASALEGVRQDLEHRLEAASSGAQLLQSEIRAREGQLDSLRAILEEKEQRLSLLSALMQERQSQMDAELALARNELEDGNRRLMDQLEQNERAASNIGLLQSSLAEASEKARVQEQEVARMRGALARRDEQLNDLASLVEMRTAQLEQVLRSNSWRISAPLRWLRSAVAHGLRGRPLPTFADISRSPPLAVGSDVHRDDGSPPDGPGAEHEVPTLPVPVPAHAPAPSEHVYLEALFAGENVRADADHVPPSALPPPAPESLRAKAIAFYLPQFHPFPENDEWWGRGFTEWTNVTKALPQFLGHHQPHLPADLGFYDLRLPEVIRQQVALAKQYGLHGFCFHYYWFGGRRLLERPLDLFVQNKDIDFPFCLCWANENWTRRWDGQDSEVLMSQEHTPENDLAFIRDLVPYLRDPRYIRINGKPLVIVYRPSLLPDCRATLARWREYCRSIGIGEIFLAMVQFDVDDPRSFGFDAAMEFPPHKLARGLDPINASLDIVNPGYQGHVVHYQAIVDSAKAWPTPEYPMVRGVFPGWDNEARRKGRGYTFAFSTPDRYRDWLSHAVDYARQHPVDGESLVMINAWNEWAEGAHLEPDTRHGHAFLQATRDVLEGQACGSIRPTARPRIVVVTHDAHPHGAQYLALHIVRELDVAFGFDVDLVLLGPGRLVEEFSRHATIHDASEIVSDELQLAALARRLRAGGASAAIVSTTVSGLFAGHLSAAGLTVATLVHELPGLIRDYQLEAHAEVIARCSHRVVFAAPQVRDGFAQFAALGNDAAVLRPQGLFTRSRHLGAVDNAGPRAALRRRLGVSPEARIVLGVGYGDRRKGLDILCDVACALGADDPSLHFVWVGHFDEPLMEEVRLRLEAAQMLQRFHAVGMEFDTDDFYAGADLYALTSREDPFPSVVLEALAVGLPVVAFTASGGARELLARGCGWLVDELTSAAFAQAVALAMADAEARACRGAAGRDIVAREFSFRRYVFDLLELVGAAPPKVSVIVPNYNYGHLLRQRLETIASQTLPPYEVIVLDDCSTDSSVEVLASLRSELPVEIDLVVGTENSGSVFRQWLKGVDRARGDLVWIAEADDLSSPDFLATVVARLQEDPSTVMSYCQSSAIGASGETLAPDYLAYTGDLSQDRWRSAYRASGREEVSAGLAIKNTIPNVSAVVFRTGALREVLSRHIDEIASYRIGGDWLVYLRLLKEGLVAYSPEVLNHHRRHERSVTGGSDQTLHLREVLSLQAYAREHYAVDAGTQAAAFAYAETLYAAFGLAHEAAPRIAAHPDLRRFTSTDATGAMQAESR